MSRTDASKRRVTCRYTGCKWVGCLLDEPIHAKSVRLALFDHKVFG